MASGSYEAELQVAMQLAREAGKAALPFYGGPLQIEYKGDIDEPVTEADYAANDVILRGLRARFPADGILSEESLDFAPDRVALRRVWIVDPLDGTQGFIAGDGDFAVQIGLAVDGESVLGVVYQPARDVMQWAARGSGAWVLRDEEQKRLRVSDESDLTRVRLAASRSHRSPRMNRVVSELGIKDEVRRGSVGVKIGLVVERECDVYIHLSGRTSQWDTCAPEAILHEAGGRLTDLFGAPLSYNSPDTQNRNGIVATNSAVHNEIIQRLRPLLEDFGRKQA